MGRDGGQRNEGRNGEGTEKRREGGRMGRDGVQRNEGKMIICGREGNKEMKGGMGRGGDRETKGR